MSDPSSQSEIEHGPDAGARQSAWPRVGGVLLVASALLWTPLPIVPFLPVSPGAKAAAAGGLVVAAEIAFWAGAALAGPQAVRRLRSWFRTRRRP